MTRRIHLRADAGPATAPLYLLGVKPDLRVTCDRNVRWYFSRSPASRPSTLRERPRRIGSAWLAQSYRRIVPFSVRIETPGHLSRGLCLLPMQMRVACSSARVKKKRDRQSGDTSGDLALPDKGRGLGGWVCPLSSCPHLKADRPVSSFAWWHPVR